jgi:endonuclease YncB( thermonuclease family)
MRAALALSAVLALPGCLMYEARGPNGEVLREIQFMRHTESRVAAGDVELYHCAHSASPGLLQAGVQGAAIGGIVTGGQPVGAAAGGVIGLLDSLLDKFTPIDQRDYCLQPWAISEGKIPDARKRVSGGAGAGRALGGSPPAPVSADPLDRALAEFRDEPPSAKPVVSFDAAGYPVPGLRIARRRVISGDVLEAEFQVAIPELGKRFQTIEQVRLRGYDAPRLEGACQRERELARDAAGRLAEIVTAARDLRFVGWDGGQPQRTARLVADGRDVAKILAAEGLASPPGIGGWCS